ncbi:hypothetical protein [Engelhardtia mirabilis]|uniref:Tetratricopeptide repeat protein n=1 Tax=Engelhardtia mirabilis TaxID=2528011 RepID=A0A518BNY4_9BACT|nr:hypothetical protein Pla133_37910 [Planctomycetes bacterium Pla133]QDV03015.1 hypothetical protein Pla86_37900 [Planctomycetes bacterium Pla86]
MTRPRAFRRAHRRVVLLAAVIGLIPCAAILARPSAASASAAAPFRGDDDAPPTLGLALDRAESLLELGDLDRARAQIERALERDARSLRAWDLRARWAEVAEDRDDLVHTLHRRLELTVAQDRPKAERAEVRERLYAVDPLARDLELLREEFVEELVKLAEGYTKEKRPHSAIRTHKEVLALDPSRIESEAAIELLAAAPDPSLAADANPPDLFADVTEEWIREHDEKHGDWGDRAKLTRDNYVTQTNAGYELMVRAGEAMEQMNAFYRVFFEYGTEDSPGGVSRIDLLIYKDRQEYLDAGAIEWSRGFFNGGAVVTYAGEDSFETIVGVLFHEAAHQFVSLATNASGWLNEGLASFFEGCRILANGTVIMNLPANHRLFPLASRMEQGWMEHVNDGVDPADPNKTPETAPTFAIVLGGRYPWGPPWYAPTWGVVYFCYNYQDPVDGRYVYRSAFRGFMDSLSSRLGDSAIEHFEEVVLGQPSKPTVKVDYTGQERLPLPKTVDELNEIWKDWILRLRDEQSGKLEVERPWRAWALYAIDRGEKDVALEHFEKGIAATPADVGLLQDFAAFLSTTLKNDDRASKLQLRAVQLLENEDPIDEKALASARRALSKYDPDRKDVEEIHDKLRSAVLGLVQRYVADGLYLQAMDLSWRFGNQLGEQRLFELYAQALAAGGRSTAIWKLAYDERGLDGWVSGETGGWTSEGVNLLGKLGEYRADSFDYRFLTFDTVTSGDYSFEAEVKVESGKGAFGGLVFGRKSDTTFHSMILFPPKRGREGAAETGYVDLTSFYGGDFKIWRHNTVQVDKGEATSATTSFHKLRVDVVGTTVDVWFDGTFIASQDFGTADVLRGGFGLVIGPGESLFRNVRYLARQPNDPASALERERRIEELMAQGQGLNGSYLGYVPPFPRVERWVRDPLADWDEIGPSPTLLAFWNIDVNEIMPLDGWLDHLMDEHGKAGLKIVNVVSPNDSERIEEYLAGTKFPGSVALDRREGFGIGDTFEDFSIDRFNLPRMLLLDLDHRVVWEGDPGFSIGTGWVPAEGSFVDAPIAELVAKRKLATLVPWREQWTATGQPALAAGRFAEAAPLLIAAEGFDARFDPQVREAKTALDSVRSSMASISVTAEAIARDGADPALDVLLDWGREVGAELTPRERKELKDVLEGRLDKAWDRAEKAVADWLKRNRRDPAAAAIDELAGELEALEGRFPTELAALIRTAWDEGGYDAVGAEAESAAQLPARWLAREYFRW